jgi:hypothetical protein
MPNSRIDNIKDKGQEAAAAAGQTFQEAKGTVKDAAANLGQQAREYTARAGEKADDALHSVGQGMSSLAGSLRQTAPEGSVLGTAAGTVAEKLDAGGRYLREHQLGDIGDEMSSVIRQYPVQSLLCVFGIGFLLGGALRR